MTISFYDFNFFNFFSIKNKFKSNKYINKIVHNINTSIGDL